MFKHDKLETVNNVNSQKEIDILEKEVAKLKDEILDLKNNVKQKENKLEARVAAESDQEKFIHSLTEENSNLKNCIIKLEDELVKVKGENESLTFQTESLEKALKSQESKNNMLMKEFEDKHATNNQRLNDLNLTINSLKNINEPFMNENRDLKINEAKEKSDSANIIEKQNIDNDRIEKGHKILKDLYEKQNIKYFNLLENKKALEESLENQERKLKIKTAICDACDICNKTFRNRTSLKKPTKTIYSKEC